MGSGRLLPRGLEGSSRRNRRFDPSVTPHQPLPWVNKCLPSPTVSVVAVLRPGVPFQEALLVRRVPLLDVCVGDPGVGRPPVRGTAPLFVVSCTPVSVEVSVVDSLLLLTSHPCELTPRLTAKTGVPDPSKPLTPFTPSRPPVPRVGRPSPPALWWGPHYLLLLQ